MILFWFTDSSYAEGIGAEALFAKITGLVQLNGYYIVADHDNHCLRKIEPDSTEGSQSLWKTSKFAGTCQTFGDIDGRRQIAKFNYPRDLLLQGNELYLTDQTNKKIKMIDLNTDLVITVHQSDSFDLLYVTAGSKGEFYATSDYGILHIENQKETWLVGGATQQFDVSNSQFSSAGFYYTRDVQWLDEDNLVVADYHAVKVINLQLAQVHTICTGKLKLVLSAIEMLKGWADYTFLQIGLLYFL